MCKVYTQSGRETATCKTLKQMDRRLGAILRKERELGTVTPGMLRRIETLLADLAAVVVDETVILCEHRTEFFPLAIVAELIESCETVRKDFTSMIANKKIVAEMLTLSLTKQLVKT